MEPSEEFRLKEFEALRSEIEQCMKELRDLERYALAAAAAIWVWLITHKIWSYLPWAIPIVIVLLAIVRTAVILKHFGTMSQYIRGTEQVLGVAGWEHFLEERRNKASRSLRMSRNISDQGPWYLLLIFTVAAFCLATSDQTRKWIGLNGTEPRTFQE